MPISSCSWVHILTFMVLVGSGFAHSSKVFHRCMHDELKPNLTILDMPGEEHKSLEDMSVDNEKHRRRLGTSTFSPIRITFDISGLSGMDSTKYDFIVNQILPSAQQVFQSFLTVSPLTSPIIMSGKTCYQASVPSQYRTTGASNTDILIFATYDTTTTGLLAWATACSLSSKNNRPIAGQINFAAANINTTVYDFRDLLKTVIHEMTHVFVFSPSLFSYFINSNGTTKTSVSANATVRNVATTVITLSSIVSWAQSYFGCSSYSGVELENQGTSASMGSHWERRVFSNELMTSSLTENAALTNLTLNLYEESGWYVVDHSKADGLFFAQGAGCSFLNSSCIVNNVSAFPSYFCSALSSEICTLDYQSKAACGFVTSLSNISSAFNYWGDGKTGSNDFFDDNCPYVENLSNGLCTNPNNQNTSWSNFFDEQYGGSSRCFVGNFIKTSAAKQYQNFAHAACLTSTCTNGTLTIMVGSTAVVCPVAGGNVSISGYTGYITCPPAADFCYRAWLNQCGNSCGGVGLCFGGACFCPSGTSSSVCNSTGITTAASTTTTTSGTSSSISSGSSDNSTINIDSQPSVALNQTSSGSRLEVISAVLSTAFIFQHLAF